MANKLHIRRDDTVVVISGKDKGKVGKVLRAMPKTGKVMVASHTYHSGQGQPGGIIRSEGAIFASKVMLYCEKCNKATRISYKVAADGKKVRVCKHCGAELG